MVEIVDLVGLDRSLVLSKARVRRASAELHRCYESRHRWMGRPEQELQAELRAAVHQLADLNRYAEHVAHERVELGQVFA